MDYKKLIKHINSKSWYRQGAAVKPLYISYPYEACSHFTVHEKLIAPFYFGYVGFFKGDYMYYHFTSESAKQVCDYYISRQIKSKEYIQELKQRWEKKHFLPLWKLSEQINNQDLSELPEPSLMKIFKSFSKIYEAAWREAIFLDAFDIHSESIANLHSKKYSTQLNQRDLQILTSGQEKTWVQRETQELLDLLKPQKDFTGRIKRHAEKWHWIENDYADIRKLTPEYFKKKLRRFQSNKALLNKQKDNLRLLNDNQKRYKKIVKRVSIANKDMSVFQGLAALAVWRDSRKAMNQIASFTVKHLVSSIGLRQAIPLRTMEELFYWEVLRAFSSKRKLLSLAMSRKQGIMMTDFPNREIKALPIQQDSIKIQKLLRKLIVKKHLSGSPAFSGIVQGHVKIILGKVDFKKMRKGDILVAPNTRPEYVPIMKLAGGIISEEGGITCHSAIVSRELRIPCIVGAQGAVSVLKDGDLVEVDANRGIVNKL